MDYEKGKYAYYIKTYGINGHTYDGEVSKAKVVKKHKGTYHYMLYQFDNGEEHYEYELYLNKKEARKALLKVLTDELIEATKDYNFFRDIVTENILKIAEDE